MVLKEITNIDEGLGAPDLYLSLALLVSWLIIMMVLIKGIHSSGKASYFLAIFPYVIMVILLIRSVTLDGASTGIIYFFKPQWDRILEPQVTLHQSSKQKQKYSPFLSSFLSSGVVCSCVTSVFLPGRVLW